MRNFFSICCCYNCVKIVKISSQLSQETWKSWISVICCNDLNAIRTNLNLQWHRTNEKILYKLLSLQTSSELWRFYQNYLSKQVILWSDAMIIMQFAPTYIFLRNQWHKTNEELLFKASVATKLFKIVKIPSLLSQETSHWIVWLSVDPSYN